MDEHGSDEEDSSVGLYGLFQTDLYEPAACVSGKVPRNKFGNLDVYVPSMIPPGTVHVRSSDAIAAARTIGISYADAVIGFQFKARQGIAVTRGVIVPSEYQEAMEATIEALRYQREYAAEQKRTQEALRLWKRFYKGLKIRERIMSESGVDEARDIADDIDEAEKAEEKAAQQGGFLFDINEAVPQPTGGRSGAAGEEDTANTKLRLTASDKRLNPREYLEPTVASPWDSTLFAQSRLNTDRKSPGLTHHLPAEECAGPPEASIDYLFDGPDGGGFIPAESDDTFGQSSALRGYDGVRESSGGFLLDRAGDSAVSSAPPEVADLDSHCSSEDVTQLAEATDVAQSKTPENNTDSFPNPIKDDSDEHEVSKRNSDEEDRGSLLSHDPEDDDAEPDWLEEVTTL